MENKRTKQAILFFLEFFKNIKMLGTPFQSSKYLVNAVANEVVGTKIVELGAGNGQITKGILAKNPKAKLYAFEINQKLVKNLKKIKNNNLYIFNKDAKDFIKYVGSFNCIVSGIPLTFTTKKTNNVILKNAKKAKRFIQYKYFPERKLLDKYFNHIQVKIVWRNLPPALVYICENRK